MLRLFSDCQKSLAEFSAKAENKVQNIFCQGVYLTENTSQAASVEFVRQRRTNYACSRLQKWRKAPKGIFDTINPGIQKNPRILDITFRLPSLR